MSLNRRQQRLYRETVNLFSPRYQKNTGRNTQVDTDYDPAGTGVKALLVNNQSPELPELDGRTEEVSIFTRDEWHFDIAQTIASGWLIQNQTIDRNGNPSPWYGKYWIVQGDSQNIPSLGGRRVNARIVKANLLPTPPKGLS
jgi:hypothetical protein